MMISGYAKTNLDEQERIIAEWKKENGYSFGNFQQTISEVLYYNFRDNTLTKTGKLLYEIIKKIDHDHFEVFEESASQDEFVEKDFEVFRKVK